MFEPTSILTGKNQVARLASTLPSVKDGKAQTLVSCLGARKLKRVGQEFLTRQTSRNYIFFADFAVLHDCIFKLLNPRRVMVGHLCLDLAWLTVRGLIKAYKTTSVVLKRSQS